MDNKNNETSISIKIPSDTIQKQIVTVTVIKKLVKAIKEQLKELDIIEHKEISKTNYEEIEGILIATDSLINDCYSTNEFTCNRNDSFIKLIYLYQRISTRLETYKLQRVLMEIECKNEELKIKQKELEDNYSKTKEENNNLVYNLLGFLASFSIVSASVEAISKINSTINVMIFMTFTILLLLTTLIALHNFYKNNNKRESKLQDNYFLWKIIVVIIVLLIIGLGIKTVNNHKDKIFNYIDKKIENVIEQKIEKELNKK